jgi:hypothetical protein
MKITLVKQSNNTFKLAYNSDYEVAKKIKVNEPIEFEFKNVRNYEFHKKYFALINMVFDNQELYNDINDLRHDLIISAGYYKEQTNIQGERIKIAKSISFAKMDELEFQELYNKTIDVVVNWLGWDFDDIVNNLKDFY